MDGFKAWFQGYDHNYAIIGGTACDILMHRAGIEFRATRDIDMVLIVEALTSDFGLRFWEYIKSGSYEHCRRSTGKPEFYRFTKPKSSDYPQMIELFSRRMDGILLPEDAVLTPLPIDENISSLSAILLDDAYYEFLKSGIQVLEGMPILDETHLIPLKAKAWLDLSSRARSGEQIDSKHIKKHRNDIVRLSALLPEDSQMQLPDIVAADMKSFLNANLETAENLIRIAIFYGLANPA
jgi:hypothetical protein